MDGVGSTGLHLATYNCFQGGATAGVVALLTGWAPGIVCLQETRDPAPLVAAAGVAGYAGHWQAAPGRAWGSALLVRGAAPAPLPLPPDLAGWVVGALLPAPPGGRPIHVYSVHAPPAARGSYPAMVGRILDVVAAGAGGADLVLGGDFNVVVGRRGPTEPVRVSRAETAILDRLEHDLHLLACWQAAHPGVPLARTLRWRHRADSLPYHCDGLFVPASWRARLQDCTILTGPPWDTASDHHPVVACFLD